MLCENEKCAKLYGTVDLVGDEICHMSLSTKEVSVAQSLKCSFIPFPFAFSFHFVLFRKPMPRKPCRNGLNCRKPHCEFQHNPSQSQYDVQVFSSFFQRLHVFPPPCVPVQILEPTGWLQKTRVPLLPPGQICSTRSKLSEISP